MKKTLVASIIFLSLFTGAWMLNEKEKREFYIPMDEDEVVEVIPIQMEDAEKQQRYRPLKVFESREYVRIIAS